MAAQLKRASDEDMADDQISIVGLLRKLGADVPDVDYGSVKIYCPFGITHIDMGIDRAMRVYPESNTCFCFAECGFYTPTRLAAAAWDVTRAEAALRLIEEAGLRSLEDRSLPVAVEPPPDTDALALALGMYLERFPPTPGTSDLLNRCLALLDSVTTSADADRWLSTCKVVLNRHIGGSHA